MPSTTSTGLPTDFVPASALRMLLWQDVRSCIQLSAICAWLLCFKYSKHRLADGMHCRVSGLVRLPTNVMLL